MKERKSILVFPFLFLGFIICLDAQKTSKSYLKEWRKMNQSKAATIEWFQDAKYGMFIHWGLYSIPAGVWDGQKIHQMRGPHVAEWIQHAAKIPREEYAQLAKSFNPIKFDPKAIAKLAKVAGMKYIVITAKHHDGYALYDSQFSEFDVIDASPFKRDIIQELYDAAKSEGLDFGIYYSHNIDWADGSDSQVEDFKEKGGWPTTHPRPTFGANTWDPSPNSFDEYLEKKAFPQVKELLMKLPELKCIWFDMPHRMNAEQSFKFYEIVYNIQPQIIVSERIGNGFGDFLIPGDNKIPENLNELVKPWETVGTFNNSWGFNGYDQDWKSPEEVLFWLIEIVSKGGNYMLNIGPTGLGGVPAESENNLRAVGGWMDVNGEAVYGTEKWMVTKEGSTYGSMKSTEDRAKKGFTLKFTAEDFWFTKKENYIYAISLAQAGKEAVIKSLNKKTLKVESVELLGEGSLVFEQTNDALRVIMPQEIKSSLGYVLKIEIK